MSTYQELIRQRDLLDQQIKAAGEREKAEGISKVKALIEQYGLTATDIFSRRAGVAKSPSGKVAPKYRDSATGEVWTGRGKAPKWIDGKDRSQFLI